MKYIKTMNINNTEKQKNIRNKIKDGGNRGNEEERDVYTKQKLIENEKY